MSQPRGASPLGGALRRLALGAAALGVGVFALHGVVKQAGTTETLALLLRALPLLPIALTIEGARIATEVVAARRLFAMQRTVVPLRAILRSQLVGYAIGNVLPVGRVAAEATKAGMLAKHAGLANTAAVATVTQALHLMASALVLLPCVIASRSSSASTGLSTAILVQCALLGAAGGSILLAAYLAPSGGGRWVARFPKIAAALAGFRVAIRSLPHFPTEALAWLVVGRLFQVLLLAVLAHAVGAAFTLAGPFVAEAVLLIGASAADVVPGQIGAFEVAFSLSCSALGMTRANAVAVALLVHVVQGLWTVAGFGAFVAARAWPKRTSRVRPAALASAST